MILAEGETVFDLAVFIAVGATSYAAGSFGLAAFIVMVAFSENDR